MAETKISDIIYANQFTAYSQLRTKELSRILSSPAVVNDADLNRYASGEGTTVNFRKWQDLSGRSQLLSDNSALVVNPITTASDSAVIHRRGKAWGSNELAANLAGADPMNQIVSLTAGFWARDIQKSLVTQLQGIADMEAAKTGAAKDAVVDISKHTVAEVTSAAAAARAGLDSIVNTIATMGDASNDLQLIIMHSVVYFNLLKLNVVTPPSETAEFGTYLGRTIIVDDGCPAPLGTVGTGPFAPRYHTFFFGRGAIAYGDGNPVGATLVETARSALDGIDLLINRKHYIIHPVGLRFTPAAGGTVNAPFAGGIAPNDVELGTAARWSRSALERKQLPMAILISNG